MGIRFRKSINLGKGFKINLSKSGIGGSWGVKGLRFTRTASGKYRGTVSLPGTGLSYSKEFGGGKKDKKKTEEEEQKRTAAEETAAEDRPIGEETAEQAVPAAEAVKEKPKAKEPSAGAGSKVVGWILTILFAAIALVNLPQVVGYVALAAAALLLPTEKWQAQIQKILPGWLKIVLVVGLAVAMLLMNPFAAIAEKFPDLSFLTSQSQQQEQDQQQDQQQPAQSGVTGQEKDYVLNTSTKKFHEPDCSSAASTKAENKKDYHGTREALINDGYVPCGKCNP